MNIGCDLSLNLTSSSAAEIRNSLTGVTEKLSVENMPLFLSVQM